MHDIRKAVCEIRKNKFPDWHSVGTAGSFFKNPTISKEAFILLSSKYPGIPGYEQKNGSYKIALGWVLDKVLSLKGYRTGAVGLYSEQALVLVNHGGATADAIKKFSDEIIKKNF